MARGCHSVRKVDVARWEREGNFLICTMYLPVASVASTCSPAWDLHILGIVMCPANSHHNLLSYFYPASADEKESNLLGFVWLQVPNYNVSGLEPGLFTAVI